MTREEIIRYLKKLEDEAYQRYLEAENMSGEEEDRRWQKWSLLNKINITILTGGEER